MLKELEWKNPAYKHPPKTELLSVVPAGTLLGLFQTHLSLGLDVYKKC